MTVLDLTITRSMSVDAAMAKLDLLDLRMIRLKLADPEEGQGWSVDELDAYEREYRRFLALNLMYQDQAIVPSHNVDMFWHAHILDTAAYRVDCEKVFGEFFDHFPYFGMRGDDDAADLAVAYDETLGLYALNFGTSPEEIWAAGKPKKCGRTNCKPQRCRGAH